jgi:hypothetical protein
VQGVDSVVSGTTSPRENVLYTARHGVFSFTKHPILTGQSIVATTDRLIISDVLKASPKDSVIPYYKIASVKANNGPLYSTIMLNLKGTPSDSAEKIKIRLWDKRDAVSIYGIISNSISQDALYSPHETPQNIAVTENAGNSASKEASLISAGSSILSGIKSISKKKARKRPQAGTFDVTRPDAVPQERMVPFYPGSTKVMQGGTLPVSNGLPDVRGIEYPGTDYGYIDDLQKDDNRVSINEVNESQIQLTRHRVMNPDAHMKIFAVRKIRERHLPRIPKPQYVRHLEGLLDAGEQRLVPLVRSAIGISVVGLGYAISYTVKATTYTARAVMRAGSKARGSRYAAMLAKEAGYEWKEYVSPAAKYVKTKVSGNKYGRTASNAIAGAFNGAKRLILNIVDRE